MRYNVCPTLRFTQENSVKMRDKPQLLWTRNKEDSIKGVNHAIKGVNHAMLLMQSRNAYGITWRGCLDRYDVTIPFSYVHTNTEMLSDMTMANMSNSGKSPCQILKICDKEALKFSMFQTCCKYTVTVTS